MQTIFSSTLTGVCEPVGRAYLVVLAVPVHHPVLAVGADLQLEVGDVVGLLRLLGNGALRGDARQNFQELQVDLRGKKEVKKVKGLIELYV